MRLKKLDLKEIPFHECNKLTTLEIAEWLKPLRYHTDWLMPQILAHYGGFKTARRQDGKHCPLSTLKTNVGTDPFELGLWRAIVKSNRSDWLVSQTKHPEYSSLVPLILAGFKKHQGIMYSSWSVEGLEHIVGDSLYQLMTYDPPDLSKDELLQLRDKGLTILSGKQAGEKRNPLTTWSLTGIKGTALDGSPRYYSAIATQIWLANPMYRNQYMILDCKDWDKMPEPLIEIEIFEAEQKPSKKAVEDTNDIPWL